MSQTKEGGIKLVSTMIDKHGSYEAWCEWMRSNASKGGLRTMESGAKPKGFAANKELARSAGKIGGTVSRRGRTQK